MLGRYQNFPENIHRVARFTHRISVRKLQSEILRTLNQLNENSFELNAIISSSLAKLRVSFEFGIADDLTFNFVDREEVERFRKIAAKEASPILDFLGVIRYHAVNNGRLVPLRFDYHFLRFFFYKNNLELQVAHERGSQRISLEDLVDFLKRRINGQLSKDCLKLLNLRELRTSPAYQEPF